MDSSRQVPSSSIRPAGEEAAGTGKETVVSVLSLGCKTNQEEMECLISRLGSAGCRIVPFGQPADWVVVNTCTVTSRGDSDSRQMVRRAVRSKGGGRVVVTGCLAQRDPQAFLAMPGVDWIVGNARKPGLEGWILGNAGGPDPAPVAAAAPERVLVDADPTLPSFPAFGAGRDGRRTRATLKIQDGCEERCAYCIVPTVRGDRRSRPLGEVLEQARTLVASGYREIVLTGINTATWGSDLGEGQDLPDLLEALEEVPEIIRVRLNSLEPQFISPDWLDRFAGCAKLCRHFHLPLQSGDAGVLRLMGRRYDPAQYARLVEELRRRMPEAAIGADVLVGFPGEEDEQFTRTEEFLTSLAPAYLHVFSFSPRPGTPAEHFPGRPGAPVARARSQRLRQLDLRLRRAFALGQLGSAQTVLPEAPSGPGSWQGLTGNYLRVRFPWEAGGTARPLPRVLLRRLAEDGALFGEVVDP